MSAEKWKVLIKLEDALQAPAIQSLLEAYGFNVIVSEESFQNAIGLSLAGAEILVPNEEYDEAKKLLDENFRGDYENTEIEDEE